MAVARQQPHFLLVTFPAQGHLNPALQFAKRLIRLGALVTFTTSVSALRHMSKGPVPEPFSDQFSFATFSDGYDDGFKAGDDAQNFLVELRRRGSQTIADLIVAAENQDRPFTGLIYTLLLPWAAEVARECHLPCTLLCIQPATVLDIYYYYFYGYKDVIESKSSSDPTSLIELPALPPLAKRDLPSFLVPSNTDNFSVLPAFQEQLEMLNKETNPTIFVNTFDALEPEALKAIENFKMIGIGPLIPSAFLDGKDPTDTSFGLDLFQSSKDCIEWLNSKSESSVIYVSFGSISVLSTPQMEELARGLLESGRPFLWVMREKQNKEEEKEEKLTCMEELEEKGMIVAWCSQVEVLSHPSVGCFVTHCGWNSSLESLVSGVPVVAFPQWSDQGTNAKLIQDVWKTGVRMRVNEEGIVEGEEIRRCLDLVMGDEERGVEFRNNAKKWRHSAMEAVNEGGSSDTNLKAFLAEFQQTCH